MNWDISIGNCRQLYGRALQSVGAHIGRRGMVLSGEQAEYRGRLQTRYGWLKHQEQWGATLVRIPRHPYPSRGTADRVE